MSFIQGTDRFIRPGSVVINRTVQSVWQNEIRQHYGSVGVSPANEISFSFFFLNRPVKLVDCLNMEYGIFIIQNFYNHIKISKILQLSRKLQYFNILSLIF